MSMRDHAKTRDNNATQRQPARKNQVKNHAGGYVFKLDPWLSLDRFLILGTTGGTYYVSERTATKEGLEPVYHCITEDGSRVVARVAEISDAGRAAKNDSAILVLGLCLSHGDAATKAAAVKAVPKVCRIGTHILQLADVLKGQRGWGRVAQKAIREWFRSKDTDALAYQAVKYKQRDGWALRDLLRLSHYKVHSPNRNAVLSYITNPKVEKGFLDGPGLLGAVTKLANIDTDAKLTAQGKRAVGDLIATHRIPREAVPTALLREPAVWEALLEDMPITALIRNLGQLSSDLGIIKPMSDYADEIADRITNRVVLQRGRVHPMFLLNALVTYRQGQGMRGSLEWTVAPEIVQALEEAYFKSFEFVEPTGLRHYLALDISGSMGARLADSWLTCAQGAACMAQVTNVTEHRTYVAGFGPDSHGRSGWRLGTQMTPLNMPKAPTLDFVHGIHGFGSTDCALPMLDAIEKDLAVDVFVIYTDNETWFGNVHPFQALRQYRAHSSIDAKLVVVGMTANPFTIADPSDAGMLDVVGFDTATPKAISTFAGRVS